MRKYIIKPTPRQAIDFLNMLIIANVGYDVAERLQGSPFDVQAIKMHLNGFKKAAERHNGIFNELNEISPSDMQTTYNNAANFIAESLKLDPVDWQYLEGLRKMLMLQPDELSTVQIKTLIKRNTQ